MVKIKLQQLIDRRGWTQTKLSEDTGIRRTTINHMCNNKIATLSVKSLNTICETLDCGIDNILEYLPDEEIKERFIRDKPHL